MRSLPDHLLFWSSRFTIGTLDFELRRVQSMANVKH